MDYMHTVWRSLAPTNQSARKHSKLAWWSSEHYSHFRSRLVCNDAESGIEKRVSSWNCHAMILGSVFNSWHWTSLQSGHRWCFVGGRNQVLTRSQRFHLHCLTDPGNVQCGTPLCGPRGQFRTVPLIMARPRSFLPYPYQSLFTDWPITGGYRTRTTDGVVK